MKAGNFTNNARSNFTQVDNGVLTDDSISWKAKGLYAWLASKPTGWDYRQSHIIKQSTDGETATRSALQELEDAGYLHRERTRVDGKLSHYKYAIYSSHNRPTCTDDDGDLSPPEGDESQTGKPSLENQDKETKSHSNTDSNNTDLGLSTKQTRTREDDTDPPDDLTAYVHWQADRIDYDVDQAHAQRVVFGVADLGLTDDEERRYIRETMTSAAIADKAPGQWAYYVIQRSNYETWKGETPEETASKGRSLMERLKNQGIK